MSENQNPNLISSRNHIEITNSSNPSISLRKVGLDYLVITQNNQNICIYRNQITDLKQALQEIDSMFEEEQLLIPDVNIPKSPFEPNRLDLLIAGKLEEYDSNPNLEFEPKTLTEENIVDSGTDETITITEVGTITPIEENIESESRYRPEFLKQLKPIEIPEKAPEKKKKTIRKKK